MKETSVQQILEELRQAYPGYEISALPTQQRGGKYLFIVKGFASGGDIDDWSVDVVYPLFSDMREVLKQNKNALIYGRLLFVRDNQFVFYTPDTCWSGNIFREMKETLHYESYGYEEYRHYIGECLNIDELLTYLTTTNVRF